MVFSAGTLPSGTSQGSLLASEAGDPSCYARASPSCPAEPCGSLHPPPGPSVPAPWNVKGTLLLIGILSRRFAERKPPC